MIALRRITDTDSQAYRFMENLLAAAFPPEEYREPAEWRKLTAASEIFRNNLICHDEMPVGLLSYWIFDRFHYVEHFAVSPEFRNDGYGARALKRLLCDLQRPVVLEVEAPDDDLSRRRIGFYQRQGFVLWEREYRQPPYRPHGDWLPMHLMVYGNLDESEFCEIRDTIYKNVYGL
ncbi:MAG: GNAT family N-acetyltransferase [Alistipes sp.]|nr:GNAT family N-acetyltransferase [Alistipes senegalensis]MCM1250525.1 GNAT family N-acetyltransferase [Alistipes sp.]